MLIKQKKHYEEKSLNLILIASIKFHDKNSCHFLQKENTAVICVDEEFRGTKLITSFVG